MLETLGAFLRRHRKRILVDGLLVALLLFVWFGRHGIRRLILTGHFQQRSVADVLEKYGAAVEAKLRPRAEAAGAAWPPARVTLIALKREEILEMWVANQAGPFHKLATYPFTANSGTLGPKRREGDLQIPEGDYAVAGLNPNSQYHLSIKVDYPNATDVRHSTVTRSEMGGDIFIHGSHYSIGCIPIGDAAIEEVFCTVALVKPEHRSILIAPVDLRRQQGFTLSGEEPWVAEMYADLATTMGAYK